MRENDPLFQHRHFLHNKFLVNDESLQIHECWHGHREDCSRLRRTVDFISKVHLGDFASNIGQ